MALFMLIGLGLGLLQSVNEATLSLWMFFHEGIIDDILKMNHGRIRMHFGFSDFFLGEDLPHFLTFVYPIHSFLRPRQILTQHILLMPILDSFLHGVSKYLAELIDLLFLLGLPFLFL